MKKIWIWLDGKKTVIGLLAGRIITLPFMDTCDPQLITILTWIFDAMAAGGLAHKGVKYLKK